MTVPDTRSFSVHARHADRHHARVLTEASFEAAAVAYAEDLPSLSDGDEISVVVRELQSGDEQCFRIDVHGGEATPCGDPAP